MRWTIEDSSKFMFLGYAGAVDARLKQAMIESEVMQEAAIINSALPVGDSTGLNAVVLHVGAALEGSAQHLMKNAGDGEGLLSLHSLVAGYEPTTAGRDVTAARGFGTDFQRRCAGFAG